MPKDTTQALKYKWTASGGKIKSGQGTTEIEVIRPDRPSETEGSMVATVEIEGLPTHCRKSESEGLIMDWLFPPRADKVYETSGKLGTKQLAEIKTTAAKIDQPNSFFFIVVTGTKKRAISSRKEKLKKLESLFRSKMSQVRFETGNVEDKVEIWIVPPGAVLPGKE